MVDAAVHIRAASETDAPALAELHLRTVLHAFAHIFPSAAPQPELASLIDDWACRIGPNRADQQACFMAVEQGPPVGVVISGPDPIAPGCGHLSRLYVDPSCWRRGIGTILYDRAITHLRRLHFPVATLWVLEENLYARNWYERLGWRPNGERITTYAPAGIDDLGYERML